MKELTKKHGNRSSLCRDIEFGLCPRKKRVLDVQGELSQIFGAALQDATENLSDSDFIRVVIHSDSLISNIVLPLRKIEHMTPQVILDHVNHVLTSHEDMPLDESFFS